MSDIFSDIELFLESYEDKLEIDNKPMSVIIKNFTDVVKKNKKYSSIIKSQIDKVNITFEEYQSAAFKFAFETSKKGLTAKEAMIYSNGDANVIQCKELLQQLNYYKFRLDAVNDITEAIGYQINNLTKLLVASLHDYIL